MRWNLRISAIFAFVAVFAVPIFGQGRTQWRTAGDIEEGVRGTVVGTVTDVNEAKRQILIQSDDDRYNDIRVITDTVSTTYNGFGTVINDKPEIFTGSAGFANVRVNDRVEVRGTGRGTGEVMADAITLLGRQVAAPQTGVGQTRPPSSVSTPTPATSSANVYARVEGVIRQVNSGDNRIVIETDRREIFNIRTSSSTPVYYRGDIYQVRNLEVGDRVRVESDGTATTPGSEINARAIDVVQSAQEASSSGRPAAQVGSLSGRVAQIDRAADVVRIDTDGGQVRVDMSRAQDATGRRMRAADLQVNDRVTIAGNYAQGSNLFLASTVRFAGNVVAPRPETPPQSGEQETERGDYAVVTIAGTVTETLQDSATLGVRDRATGKVYDIFVTDDFAVRMRSGSYQTADRLSTGDSVLLKAFRDEEGNLIAQTIRMR